MNNITIGQYVPGNSWIYKMDPRMKIILTFLLLVLIFFIPTILIMGIALGVFILIFLSTRIPPLKALKGLKTVLFLLSFTFILQIIYNKEGTLWYTFEFQFGLFQLLAILGILILYFATRKIINFGFLYLLFAFLACFAVQWLIHIDSFHWGTYHLAVWSGGVSKAVFIFIRIVIMIGVTSLLTFSTSNTEINNGISAVLSPLKIIKVPVGMISMTLSLTLRFIPTLLEETQKIMKAQASRGVDFSEGNIKEKINQIVALLIPMFVISFRRADDLSNAMEARGYIIDAPRTRYDLLKLRWIDYLSLFMVLGFFTVVLVFRYAL